jgi:hypothetical protein
LTRELFIYWRVASADLAEAMAALHRFHDRLRQMYPGLQAGRYLRSDRAGATSGADADQAATVLETYADGQGVDEAMAATIRTEGESALGRLALGQRTVEAFERMD